MRSRPAGALGDMDGLLGPSAGHGALVAPVCDFTIMSRQGAIFTAGVVASFLALGGLMLALRAGGEQLGWGFQLQSPGVVAALAAVGITHARIPTSRRSSCYSTRSSSQSSSRSS